MERIIGFISFVLMGIFLILNPIFSHRGGTTDFSYMNFNVLFGFVLISLGILLLISKVKKRDDK